MRQVLVNLSPESGTVFVDIGMNVGQTLLSVREALAGIDYIGFEPNPDCVSYVRKLVERNRLEEVRLICAGIGMTTSVKTLYSYSDAPGDSGASIVPDFRGCPHSRLSVFVIGAEIVTNLLRDEPVSIVKIDVEGGECEVLEALRGLLSEKRPHILMEILPNYNGSNKDRVERQNRIEMLLQELEYGIFRIIKDSGNCLERLEQVDGFGFHSSLELCDYLLVPS